MLKKSASRLLILFLLSNLLTCALIVQSAAASGDIFIKADGSIDPSTAPILRNVNVYTFTDNIDGNIIVQRDDVVINGAGHILQGTGVEIGIDLSGRTNVTVRNMVIKTFDDAIYLYSSNQITISGTNITDSTDVGIHIIASSNNTVSENNIIANTGDGVFVVSSSNNTIFENNISNNWWGITSYYSTNDKIFHNNFIDNNPSQANLDLSLETWDNGYPSGGNYWNDYSGTDHRCGPSQDHPGSDGMGDTPYTIDSSNRDNYPLMNPWTPPSGHNVAVISVVPSKVVIGQGFTGNITVYGANKGEYSETFNVTAYANMSKIASANVPLQSGSTATITFSWTPTNPSFSKGNYSISAYAWPVPSESDASDNNFTGGYVSVATIGDVTGGTRNPWDFVPDGKVDGKDIAIVALCFGSAPGCPPPYTWNSNCDVNNDGKVDGKDIALVAIHFGQAG